MKLLPDIAFLASAATLLTTHAAAAAAAAQPVKADPETQYKHFVAHHESHTCSADAHATPFNNQIRGVNLGGWMVLEPWITPSLFYQFLGKDESTTGLDMHSFCEVLGPEEGNKQLQRHWKTWVTEEIIQKLAQSGAVNSLRLPVGDWMYKPYGPYIGCTDGALDHVDYVLDWAHENGLTILFDIHGVKGSQNGFDNSGQSQGFEWTSLLVSLFVLLSSSVQSFIHHFESNIQLSFSFFSEYCPSK
jgi:glucan 1,3-beta-glucosidase